MSKGKPGRKKSQRIDRGSVFEILKEDHKNVKGLFEQILKERERDEETFTEINRELQVHMTAEERHLYPVLENEEQTRDMILESYEEHNLGKELIEKLNSDSFDDERWLAKIKVLSDVIDHHIEEEEGLMFPKAKKLINKEDEQRILESVLQEKGREAEFGGGGVEEEITGGEGEEEEPPDEEGE